jgi:hypothetical protein
LGNMGFFWPSGSVGAMPPRGERVGEGGGISIGNQFLLQIYYH